MKGHSGQVPSCRKTAWPQRSQGRMQFIPGDNLAGRSPLNHQLQHDTIPGLSPCPAQLSLTPWKVSPREHFSFPWAGAAARALYSHSRLLPCWCWTLPPTQLSVLGQPKACPLVLLLFTDATGMNGWGKPEKTGEQCAVLLWEWRHSSHLKPVWVRRLTLEVSAVPRYWNAQVWPCRVTCCRIIPVHISRVISQRQTHLCTQSQHTHISFPLASSGYRWLFIFKLN